MKCLVNMMLLFFLRFSENYGHVIAESLMVGTPVIISDQTPWNDVTEANAGWAIPLHNTDKFTKAIQTIIDSNDDFFQRNVETYISEKLRIDQLYDEYQNMLKC